MGRSFLHLEYSSWWVLPILAFSMVLTYFLYAKKNVPWSNLQNWILALLRFLTLTFLLLLLLMPSVRRVTNTIVKPLITIALDNSQSILARMDDRQSVPESILNSERELNEMGLETLIISHDDSMSFNSSTTNLSSLMKKTILMAEDRNHVGMILVSDGIYNGGYSPLHKDYLIPVFTIGMGDTIPPRDINISRVRYNKLTFKENETPILLEINQNGYENKAVTVELREQKNLLAKQKIHLKTKIQEVSFMIKSKKKGLRHIVAVVTTMDGESTFANNKSDIFMEVIDGSQKILIVANEPHPDIKAIRSSLAETGNYQTELYIPTITRKKITEMYDVVIFHGAFSSNMRFVPKGNPGIWYILSNKSSIPSINKMLPYISIKRIGLRPDKVMGFYNQSFSKFKLENAEGFEEYPPIEVPFGDYILIGSVEVLMYQKIGSVKTNKPLMTFFDDGTQRSTLLLGQNIWRWKLQEAAINKNTENFDNLITKTIQFLSTKNDKKQFRFNARTNNFSNHEPVLFDVEVYNDIYERVYDNDMVITITGESKRGKSETFNFTDSEYNSTFQLPTFSPGIYKYRAEVVLGGKELVDIGEFSVQNINPEFLNLTADHQMLKNLASKTEGFYVSFNAIDDMLREIESRDFKSVIKSKDELTPLYQTWWWYLIILGGISSEWILRKYWGGY